MIDKNGDGKLIKREFFSGARMMIPKPWLLLNEP
jgi:hypothetical protein